MSEGKALRVKVDGTMMPEDDAREFWKRFSDHMEANKGDLAGFAVKEGMASVRPSFEGGAAILIASHSEAQVPYTNVTAAQESAGKGSTTGSPKNQARDKRPGKKR